MSSPYGLSYSKCDKTFKNVLRGNEEVLYIFIQTVHNEHKLVSYKDVPNARKSENTAIFEDAYKGSVVNEDKKQQRFTNNYVKGNLKTNIIFDDDYVCILYIIYIENN